MGLDMYLNEKIITNMDCDDDEFVEFENVEGKKKNIQKNKICCIEVERGYWRKANAIHNWFVKNVQDGIDNCSQYCVSYEKLCALKYVCEKSLDSLEFARENLPTNSNPAFGSQDYDEYYYDYLKSTIKIINSLDGDGLYFYESSW
jgi:hypothetical protein